MDEPTQGKSVNNDNMNVSGNIFSSRSSLTKSLSSSSNSDDDKTAVFSVGDRSPNWSIRSRRSKSKLEKPPGCRSRWSQASMAERIVWLISIPIRALFCFCNVFIFFVTYFGFMLPILWAKVLWPRFYWFYEGKLYVWLQAFIAYWGYTADYDVYEYGDDISAYGEKDRVLVICNHQSTADVPTLFTVLQKKGVAARKAMWLMDIMFRWTPFGIIGRNHGDYFIQQGKATREKEIIRLREHLRSTFWDRDRRWVIMFPEGGFYCNRWESSQRYGRENGFPYLEHTTLPRMGAVQAILREIGPRHDESDSDSEDLPKSKSGSRLKIIKDTVDALREKKYVKEARPPIKYVLDVTIAYPNGHPLSLETLLFGTREKCDIAVNYKMYKAEEVAFNDDNALRDWMYKLYEEKDKLLDNYYKYETFNIGETGSRIAFSWARIIGMYTFWFIGFLVQLKLYPWLLYKFWSFLYGY